MKKMMIKLSHLQHLFSEEMAKVKSCKLGHSFLKSFHLCRPKNPSSMIKSPSPAISYTFSPLNSKAFDISFPAPPPTTPSKSCTMQDTGFTSHAYCKPRNEGNIMRSSPLSRTEKKDENLIQKSQKAAGIGTSSTSGDSDEIDSLFSSPPSFDLSHDFNHSLKQTTSGGRRRFKRYGSKEWKGGGEDYYEKKPVSAERLTPCMVDGKYDHSLVVVKRSVNPCEDFKKSMSEMILEKQMFEPKELEHLLMSFLSLNSTQHHKVIIEAFTEILKEVFCG